MSKRVLNNLDDQTLTRSKEVNRDIAKSLEDERFYWIRTIKKHVENFKGHEQSWKEVIFKTPINIVKQLAVAVQLFFKSYWRKDVKVAPLHIAAEKGSLQLCQYVITKTKDKNPQGKLVIDVDSYKTPKKFAIKNQRFKTLIGSDWKSTPLHIGAMNGNAELCRLIMDNVDDGNPKDKMGYTPLAMAAANGHLEVCRLIIERVKDKNPANNFGTTPLHRAAENGNFGVCRLIIEKIEVKNPANNDGWTPLHYAAGYGHLDVCRLIIANVVNKHPVNNHGSTPKDLAVMSHRVKVSQLFQ